MLPRNSEVNPLQSTSNGWYGRSLFRQDSPDHSRKEGLESGPILLPAIRFNRVISKDRVDHKKHGRLHQISISTLKKKPTLLEEYELREKIGEGAFAEVFAALDPRSRRKVVVKTYDKYKLFDKQRKNNLKNEIALLRRLQHPNIIELVETVQTNKSINIVMEHFSTTTLRKMVASSSLCEQNFRKIIKQLAEALHYMHQEGIAHRDIKLENVLVDQEFNVKLIDFGFAVEPRGPMESTVVGTPNYISPEQITSKHYDPCKADVWALGVLLYFLVTGYFPFRGDTKLLYKKIGKGEIQYPRDLNPGCEYLLRKMLNPDPSQRIAAGEIAKDTWIRPVNFHEQISLLKKQL